MFKLKNTLLIAAVVGLAALTGCNKASDQGGKPTTGSAEKTTAAAAEPVAMVNGTAIGNHAKVGDMGIDGRIYPVSVEKRKQPGKDLFQHAW
ncbi:MAG: hypothetical protein M1283_05825, partial [Gammaproteobacteria bacterium]|nr:hypothetical protein [Gammaproteobacteria bacterium]